MDWVVARRSLSYWTRSKLVSFNEEHLGEGNWAEQTDDALRLAARSVIDGNLESQQFAEMKALNSQMMSFISKFASPGVAPAATPATSAFRPVAGPVAIAPPPAPAAPEATPPKPSQSPPSRSNSTTHGDHPRVIFSYQSTQVKFMHRLRAYMNERGIKTVDGTQVPPGTDWRVFYFSALKKGDILLPVLSKTFIFSRACESELTYGEDKRKIIIPILADPEYMNVLNSPEEFVEFDNDIELRAPKIEAILSQSNRFPANGCFEEDFDGNAATLYKMIEAELAKKRPTSNISGGHSPETPNPWEGVTGEDSIQKMLNFLGKAPIAEEAALATLKALNAQLYVDDELSLEACTKAIKVGPAVVLSKLLTHSNPSIVAQAAEITKDLCTVGGHFGAGVLNFRQAMVDQDVVPRLLAAMRVSEESKESKALTHMAIMALNYVTRVKQGKKLLAEAHGIQSMIELVTHPNSTSQSKSVALAILWNEVYPKENKDILIQSGVVQMIQTYIGDQKATNEGLKCCYFLMSHLSYVYPVEVNDSGIVDFALAQLREYECPLPVSMLQTVEGACRLLDTIAMNETTRPTLTSRAGRDTIHTLLNALSCLYQASESQLVRKASDLKGSATAEKEGPPRDAFKMRAAAALNWMVKKPSSPEATTASEEVQAAVLVFLKSLVDEQNADEHTLVWLAVQPGLRALITRCPELVQLLHNKLSVKPTVDLLILTLAPFSQWKEAQTLLDSPFRNTTLAEVLLETFDGAGSSQCSRWAILSQSLMQCDLAQNIAATWSGSADSFVPQLIRKLILWLRSGHPYKADASKVLSILVRNPNLQAVACEEVHHGLHLLTPDTCAMGKEAVAALKSATGEGSEAGSPGEQLDCVITFLHKAFGELSTQ